MSWFFMLMWLLCLSRGYFLTYDLGLFVEDCRDTTSGLRTLVNQLKATVNVTVFFFPCNNAGAIIPKVCSFPRSASMIIYGVAGQPRSYEHLSLIFKEIEFNSSRSKSYFNLRQALSMPKSSYKYFLYDVIREWKWNYIFVYLDGKYDNFIPTCTTVRANQSAYCHFALVATTQHTNTSEFLLMTRTEYISSYSHRFIVACDDFRTVQLIEQASLLGMFDNEYHWLLLNDGTERVMRALRSMQIDSNIRLARAIQNDKADVYLPHDTRTLFSRHSNTSVFITNPLTPESYNSYCTQSESTLPSVRNESIPQHNANPEIEIVEVTPALSREKDPDLKRVAAWKPGTGFKLKKQHRQLRHFAGVHLKVATIDTPPYVLVDETSGKITGYLPELVEIVSQRLNFSYTFMPMPDQEYGRLVNGTVWTGIIGAVSREEADLGVANLTPTGDRSAVVRFLTTDVAIGGYRLLYLRPDAFKKDAKVNAFVNPFHATCWVSISLTLLLMAFLVCWTFNYHRKEDQCVNNPEKASKQTVSNNIADGFRIRNCIFIALQVAALQGFPEVPDAASSRIIFLSLWLFSLLVMAGYSATLTSYYTYNEENLPFTSLAGFLKQSEYKIAYKRGTSYVMLMNKATSGEFWEISQRLASDPKALVDDIMKGHELAKTEKYVFAHDQQTLRWLAGSTCGMVVVGPTYFRAGVTFAVPHNSPYHKDLSLALAYLWEDGLMSRLQKKWWPKPLDCSMSNEKFHSITAADVLFPFLLLTLGIAFGTGVITLEKFSALLSRSSSFPLNCQVPSTTLNRKQSHGGQRSFSSLTSSRKWTLKYRSFCRSKYSGFSKPRSAVFT